MVVLARRGQLPECLRIGDEVFHAPKGTLHARGLSTAVGDEAVRAGPRLQRGGARDAARGHRGGRLGREHRSRWRSTPRPASSTATAPTSWPTRGARLPPGSWPTTGGLASRYPIVSIEDGMDEEDWAAGRPHRQARGACPARRRRPVRDEHRAPAQGYRAGRGQLDPHQGQPDRHLTETLQAIAMARRPTTRP
jgi:enolase